jgi:hypothetical protein
MFVDVKPMVNIATVAMTMLTENLLSVLIVLF